MLGFGKISAQKRVDFAKNLAVMLKSGITINEALGYLADQERSKKFKNIILRVKNNIELGGALGDAFEKEKSTFGGIFSGVVRAGEASGGLEENLMFLASWLDRENDLRNSLNSALLYPKIITGGMLLVGGGVTFFFLPRLVSVFYSLDVDLPITTRLLINLVEFSKNYWHVMVGGSVGFIILFRLSKKIRFFAKIIHTTSLKLPIFGDITLHYQLAVICQIFATLFRSGISVHELLSVSADAVNNILYKESIRAIKDRVINGISVSDAMRDFPKLFPKNFVNIVSVGERSGTLDESFLYLADFYSKEVYNKTKNLPTTIEPILLMLIGIMVGLIAFSVIFPLYSLVSSFEV